MKAGTAGSSVRRCVGASVRLLVLLAASGCAYYNGMYNAKRAARDAERSERAGRRAEARERWQRAAVHAESVATRHPRSRWADDAMLLRGRALVRLEFYTEAAVVLERAARSAGTTEQRREALLLLGRAQLTLGQWPEARRTLDQAAESRDPRRRAEALLYRGRVWLALGAPDAAAADFAASSHPNAPFDRARTSLLLRDTAAAVALFDSLALARPYVERDWLSVLDSLGAAGAGGRAALLVGRLVGREDVGRGERARLLLGEGDRRLARGDSSGADVAFRGVQRVAGDSTEARLAAVRLARMAIAVAGTEEDLAAPREQLTLLASQGGSAAREAQGVLRMLGRLDTLAAAVTSPDAYWFQRAELIRDSLHAHPLAAVAFAEMAARFPESPWTPKGLVAALADGHPAADSLRGVLEQRYRTSPYLLAASGARTDSFAVLEDSLRRVLVRRAAVGPGGVAAPGAARVRGEEDDATVEEEISRRRQRPPAQASPQRPPSPPRPASPQPRPPTPVP